MTEILERDDTEGLEPDQWAGIRAIYDPRRQEELDQLSAEFFQRGGVASWLPPVKTKEEVRKDDYYYAPKKKEVKERGDKVGARVCEGDNWLVRDLEVWLNKQNCPVSRRGLAKALSITEHTLCRLLVTYFTDHPKYDKLKPNYSDDRKAKQEEKDLLLKQTMEYLGPIGYTALAATMGVSQNVVHRIASKYGLDMRKGVGA